MKLTPKIKPHPRLRNAVEFEVVRDNFPIETGVSVKDSLEEAFHDAKVRILTLFPQLSSEDFGGLQLPDGN